MTAWVWQVWKHHQVAICQEDGKPVNENDGCKAMLQASLGRGSRWT